MHVSPLRTLPLSRHAPNAWNADAGQANARNNAAAPTCFVIMACHHQIIESQACTARALTLRRRCQERHPGAEARRSTGKNALYMRPRGGAYASTNPIQRNTATAVSGPGPMPHSSRSLSPSKLTANPVQKNGHPKNPLRAQYLSCVGAAFPHFFGLKIADESRAHRWHDVRGSV